MTPPTRRQTLLAAAVVVVLVGVVYTNRRDRAPAAPGAAPSNRVAGAAQPGGTTQVVDVQLDLLKNVGTEEAEPDRNPFRFQPKPPPPAPAPRASTAGRAAGPPAPVAPQGPPPPPPIPLRFIGLVDAPTQAGRVAILSDGRGNVFYGKEGDIIEGRYRLLRVGPDAAELAYTDGRGRQAVRLSGQ